MNIVEEFKNMLAKFSGVADRLESLSTQNATAAADLQAKDAEIAQLKADKSDLEGKISAAVTQEAFDAEKLRADNAVKALEDEQAAMPEKINAKAAELVAANGHQQVSTATGKQESAQVKTISRAEFNALSAAQRESHFKSGGKISE